MSRTAPNILWHSAPPWASSAYGQQTNLVLQSLRAHGYTFDLSCPTGAEAIEVNGLHCWPSPTLDAISLRENMERAFPPGAPARAVAFTDPIRLSNDSLDGLDVLFYLPFNFEPPPPSLLEFLRNADRRLVVPSIWARDLLADFDIRVEYLPHGIDVSIFRPASNTVKAELRQRLGLPTDAFIVSMVGVNNEWQASRKNYPEALLAFAEFASNRTDALLYLHTRIDGVGGSGLDLGAILASLDIDLNQVFATDQSSLRVGLSREEMASIYQMSDVLLAPSAGEGFGVPVLEAQACGTPVIVSRFSAQPELVGDGWIVDGQRRWAPYQSSWVFTPHIDELVSALVDAYSSNSGSSSRAVQFAAGFDHRIIVDTKWLPLLRNWIGEPSNNSASHE